MKKFEEELKDNNLEILVSNTGSSLYGQSYLNYDTVVELSEGWGSPEDHQAEIGKIELQNLKYREEIARMQKSLRKKNKAIKELNGAVKKSKARLKECEDLRIEANNEAAMEYSRKCEVVEERAELKRENQRLRAENLAVKTLVEDAKKQQPEIPEVPQFVAEWYEENKERLEIALWDYICDFEHQEKDEFHEFMKRITTKPLETIFSMKNGYTVAKEKRFYLKNKLTGDCLARCLSRASSGLYVEVTEKWLTRKEQTSYQLSFTQQEIDSMETGSYEQIEVEE